MCWQGDPLCVSVPLYDVNVFPGLFFQDGTVETNICKFFGIVFSGEHAHCTNVVFVHVDYKEWNIFLEFPHPPWPAFTAHVLSEQTLGSSTERH